MKKVTISINGKTPFVTSKRSDLEDLLEQMIVVHNTFRSVPNCMFSVTHNDKTVIVEWEYLRKLIPGATSNGIAFTNKLANKVLEDLL